MNPHTHHKKYEWKILVGDINRPLVGCGSEYIKLSEEVPSVNKAVSVAMSSLPLNKVFKSG